MMVVDEMQRAEIALANGERFMPRWSGDMALEHVHRYLFACDHVAGKTVLDIASGEGYGAALLAERAARVIGVDISPLAAAYARAKYRLPNLAFLTGSCTAIPLRSGSIDVAVSFETIEHLVQHADMLKELVRVLRPDGLLIMSSPDKLEYSDKPNYHNPFHLRELYRNEFFDLLGRYFANHVELGQRIVQGSVILSASAGPEIQSFVQGEHGYLCFPEPHAPRYWMALASDAQLPSVRNWRGPSTRAARQVLHESDQCGVPPETTGKTGRQAASLRQRVTPPSRDPTRVAGTCPLLPRTAMRSASP